jgi:hypothetical protein
MFNLSFAQLESATLRWVDGTPILSAIIITTTTTTTTTTLTTELSLKCHWFNESAAMWLTDGCSTTVNDSTVSCTCNHMTTFAVFFVGNAAADAETAAEAASLSVITYIGGAISMACCVVTAGIFLSCANSAWVDASHLLVAHLSLALLGVQACFMAAAANIAQHHRSGCQTLAILLHFFLLASFAWSAAEGLNLYKSFVQVMRGRKLGDHGHFTRLAVMVWGLAAVIVSICLAVDLGNYGTTEYCWINVQSPLIYAFYVPVGLLVAFNLVVLLLVARVIQRHVDARSAFCAAFSFFWLMSLGWIFGLLLLTENDVVWQFLFAFCMTLQGIFIFVSSVWRNQKLRRMLCNRRAATSSKPLDARDSSHAAPPPGPIAFRWSRLSLSWLTGGRRRPPGVVKTDSAEHTVSAEANCSGSYSQELWQSQSQLQSLSADANSLECGPITVKLSGRLLSVGKNGRSSASPHGERNGINMDRHLVSFRGYDHRDHNSSPFGDSIDGTPTFATKQTSGDSDGRESALSLSSVNDNVYYALRSRVLNTAPSLMENKAGTTIEEPEEKRTSRTPSLSSTESNNAASGNAASDDLHLRQDSQQFMVLPRQLYVVCESGDDGDEHCSRRCAVLPPSPMSSTKV